MHSMNGPERAVLHSSTLRFAAVKRSAATVRCVSLRSVVEQ
jgi:hypothetical protein